MRFQTIEGLEIAYQDLGAGPAVILAHCSSASHREWAELVPTLIDRYRVLAPDLIGYGRSERWPADRSFDFTADVAVLTGMARTVAGPVHLVGHSYGGAVALETARLLGDRVASLTLIEPVTFHVLRLAGLPAEWDEILAVARGVRADVATGRLERAAARYMGFWIGRLRWWAMSRRARRRIVETVGKVALEFSIAESIETTLADYRAIDVPTRLVMGERSPAPARAVTEVLGKLLPRAEVRVVKGAGHMSPYTHPQAVFGLVRDQLARAAGGRSDTPAAA